MTRIAILPDDKVFDEADETLSLLAVSRKHGIPHASACGGHARCSTCRVLVVAGGENLTQPTEAESRLRLIKGMEEEVRLACQTMAHGPVTVRRLVLDECDQELAQGTCHCTGKEITLAILFSDLRNFTHFAETHLPYDVVHILNRYFQRMGEAVLQHGGFIDKYIGDGMMAVFGLEGGEPAHSCRQAVGAALAMVDELAGLNDYLDRLFSTRFAMGIGVHVGEVIVADMGHPKRMQFTAIGDAVNVASRIETATKEIGARVLASTDVLAAVGPGLHIGRRCSVALKGKAAPMELVEVLGLNR